MNDREPPGYDDWFDEPEPPTLESGRAGRQSYDAPHEPEEDVWTLPEDEPRRSRRSQKGTVTIGGHSFTTTQVAIIAIAALAIIVALAAAAGLFSDPPAATTQQSNTTETTLPTTHTITTTITVKVPTKVPIQSGDTGAQVVLLQKALLQLGYLQPPATADGVFGQDTKTAVISFQGANGLDTDGIVGQETLTKLTEQVRRRADSLGFVGGFDDVLAANEEYARRYALGGLTGRAAKGLAVLTCMDSRIEPLQMLGLVPGEAKILRNAGARVDDGVIAALALAHEQLNVTRAMVVAHTDCAATGPEERETNLRADVARLRLELPQIEAGGFVYAVETGVLSRIC